MSEQDNYRQNAEYAQAMADQAAMEEDRSAWLKVAAGWRSLLPRHQPNGNKDRFEG